MNKETIDASIAAIGSKTTYAGAGVTGLGWFLSNQFFGLMGVVIAIAGLAMNFYFKRRADARIAAECAHRREERQIRIDLMRATGAPYEDHRPSELGAWEDKE